MGCPAGLWRGHAPLWHSAGRDPHWTRADQGRQEARGSCEMRERSTRRMSESSRRAEDVNISAQEAQARQQAGAVMLDVREPDEWQEGHIPGARHVPLGELEMRLGELDPTQEIFAGGHNGYPNGIGADAFGGKGIARRWDLGGGGLAGGRG